jgi:hypothetical protein
MECLVTRHIFAVVRAVGIVAFRVIDHRGFAGGILEDGAGELFVWPGVVNKAFFGIDAADAIGPHSDNGKVQLLALRRAENRCDLLGGAMTRNKRIGDCPHRLVAIGTPPVNLTHPGDADRHYPN